MLTMRNSTAELRTAISPVLTRSMLYFLRLLKEYRVLSVLSVPINFRLSSTQRWMKEQYGPIFTIHLGMNKAVVLTGLESIKEALVEGADKFSDRAHLPIFNAIQRGNGVFFSSGEMWRTTRRFTISSMKNLGMGKKHIEDKIVEELQFLTNKIESYAGQQFKLREFACGPTNITFAMIFGNRFDYSDPIYIQLLDLIDEIVVLLGSPYLQLFNMYPMLAMFMKTHKIILKNIDKICDVLKTDIQAKRNKMDERTNKDSLFNDANVLATVLDLVMAGTETTSSTLQWGILLMMKYPEVQKKVQKEIHSVLESGRLPQFEDRNAMPYTHAVIHEVQRFANLLPNVPHATSTDTYFKGYHIPKGTTVIPLLTSVLHGKHHWETPLQFNPNHFLDAEGKFVKNEAFLPFSTGRRLCLGESLAKMELFIFFTGLLQKFNFTPPHGMEVVNPAVLASPPHIIVNPAHGPLHRNFGLLPHAAANCPTPPPAACS
ncbi:hypothetical protein GDO78_019489, partial [Eleutherodactylus coqui]